MSFDSKFSGGSFDRITGHNGGHEEMRLLPLFKFTLMRPDTVPTVERYHVQRVEDFRKRVDNEYLTLSWRESNIPADTLVMLDKQYVEELKSDRASWTVLFERGVTQSLIKQYTNAVNTFSAAIEQNPSNPFLYLNRSTTRAEMIDFISSIDNSYQRITIDSDPANRRELLAERRLFDSMLMLADPGRTTRKPKVLTLPRWTREVLKYAAVILVVAGAGGIYVSRMYDKFLLTGNTITVPAGQHIDVQLPDGTKVCMNALSELHYPTFFIGRERKVQLKGEAFFDVDRKSVV